MALWIRCLVTALANFGDTGEPAPVARDLFVRIEAPDGTPLRQTEFDLEGTGSLPLLDGGDWDLPLSAELPRERMPPRCVILALPYALPVAPNRTAARLPDLSRLVTDDDGILCIRPGTPRRCRYPDGLDLALARADAPWWVGTLGLPLTGDVGTLAHPATVRLAVEAGVLAGRVVDDRGEPIPFVWQSADPLPSSGGCFDRSSRPNACASSFRIACGRRPTSLRFSSPGHVSRVVVAVPSSEPVRIVLPRAARLDARIDLPDDVPAEWFALRTARDPGSSADTFVVHHESQCFDFLDSGEVTVELVVRSTGEVLDSARTTLATGSSTAVELTVPPLEIATLEFSLDGAAPRFVGVETPSGWRVCANAAGVVRVPCGREGIDLVISGFEVVERAVRAPPGVTIVELARTR